MTTTETWTLRAALESCAALLGTIAEAAENDGDIATWSMASVMAENARRVLAASTPPKLDGLLHGEIRTNEVKW